MCGPHRAAAAGRRHELGQAHGALSNDRSAGRDLRACRARMASNSSGPARSSAREDFSYLRPTMNPSLAEKIVEGLSADLQDLLVREAFVRARRTQVAATLESKRAAQA